MLRSRADSVKLRQAESKRPMDRAAVRVVARRIAACIAIFALPACAPLPVERPFTIMPNVAADQRPSPNFDQRRPSYIVLHHTSDSGIEEAVRTLTTRESGVSSHYLISHDGKIFYLVDEAHRAWHAGE